MASTASVCLADSWRTSSLTSVRPKATTRRSTSVSRPSAMRSLPTERSEASQRRSGSASSSSLVSGIAWSSGRAAPVSSASTTLTVASMRRCSSRSTARYGSCAPWARANSSGLARAIDSSKRSISTSRAYSVNAVQRDINAARLVTSGVTDGLPSRSPPIHEPKRMGAASSGRDLFTIRRRVRSSDRHSSGTAFQIVSSNTAMPERTSSSGDGRSRLTSSVCQAPAISRRIDSSSASRSVGVRSGRSRPASAAATRLYLCCSVRRMISVGCAVITSSTRRPQMASNSASGETPVPSSRGSASSIDASCGRPPSSRSSSRRRRTR